MVRGSRRRQPERRSAKISRDQGQTSNISTARVLLLSRFGRLGHTSWRRGRRGGAGLARKGRARLSIPPRITCTWPAANPLRGPCNVQRRRGEARRPRWRVARRRRSDRGDLRTGGGCQRLGLPPLHRDRPQPHAPEIELAIAGPAKEGVGSLSLEEGEQRESGFLVRTLLRPGDVKCSTLPTSC